MIEGRTVVVFGAAGGIGTALVRRLLERGLYVVGVDCVSAYTDSARYMHVATDAASGEGAPLLAERLQGHRVAALVNVAGGATEREITQSSTSRALDLDLGILEDTLKANLHTSLTTIRLAQMLRPGAKDESLSVVLCSSINAIGHFQYPLYSASKAAVESLVLTMAVPLGRIGVRINCVRLGTVVTPASLGLHADAGDTHYKPLENLSAIGRFLTSEQAADALIATGLELTGVTGVVIPVDGGQSIPGVR